MDDKDKHDSILDAPLDCDNSHCISKSCGVHNKSNQGEFSIERFNISSGGLKLTISCRKKSSEDEVPEKRTDRLDGPTRTDLSNKKIPQFLESSTMNVKKDSQYSNEEDHISPLSIPKSDNDERLQHNENELRVKIAASPLPHRLNDVQQQAMDSFSSQLSENKAPKGKEVSHVDEYEVVHRAGDNNVKHPIKKGIGSSCAVVVQEPILKIDTLPNVSPESGISSLDEAPYGNESPEFTVNLRDSSLEQQGTGSGSSAQRVSKTSNVAVLSEHPVTKDKLHQSGVIAGISCVEPKQSVIGTETEPDNQNNVDRPTQYQSMVSEECHPPTLEISVAECPNKSSLSPHNPQNIIVSSPHKISQTVGRKKRGRSAKGSSAKKMVLKHKKSILYSSSFESKTLNQDLIDKAGLESTVPREDLSDPLGTFGNICDSKPPVCTKLNTFQNHLSESKKTTSVHQTSKISGVGQSQQKEPPKKQQNMEIEADSDSHVAAWIAPKRPRGRPRKTGTYTEVSKTSNENLQGAEGSLISRGATKVGKRKHSKRKLMFTHTKRKTKRYSLPSQDNWQNNSAQDIAQRDIHDTCQEDDADDSNQPCVEENYVYPPVLDMLPKASGKGPILNKEHKVTETIHAKIPSHLGHESSVFQDNDLDALLLSVKSSIKSQFKEDVNSVLIPSPTFGNPFTVMQQPAFPKIAAQCSPKIVKPKPKRPKLHVMMRQTKRKKKKAVIKKPISTPEPKLPIPTTPPRLDMFCPVAPPEKIDKFGSSLLLDRKSTNSTFASALTFAKRPFFTSCLQPSKILASSRLNVFRSGTGVDEPQRNVSPPGVDSSLIDSYEKRSKKRHKLLYRKSKHKNIVDPVFAADLDLILGSLGSMTICEDPTGNFIRVRPGEVPLPSIFRVNKIDVNRRIKEKEKLFNPESPSSDKIKWPKPWKDTLPPSDQLSPSVFKPVIKSGRKKSLSDAGYPAAALISEPCDQRLPPKKRHRLVNVETTPFNDTESVEFTDLTSKDDAKLGAKKKVKRFRRISGQEDGKSDVGQMVGSFAVSQSVCQELTIDTSEGLLMAYTPSMSPCYSRLSTRSSTLPSLSSPSGSPAGSSTSFRGRSSTVGKPVTSFGPLSMTCPLHAGALSSSALAVPERASCAECLLLQQSSASTISPGSLRSGRFNLRPLSTAAASMDSNLPGKRLGSMDQSPGQPKHTPPVLEKPSPSSSRGSLRKRRKSSVPSGGEESDSSPPRLEKSACISPRTNLDSNFFSEPPVITIPEKCFDSPKQISSAKSSTLSISPKFTPKASKKRGEQRATM